MSNRKLLLAALPLFVACSGCAESSQFVAKRQRIAQTTPECVSGQDCDAKWEAARHWVYNHAGFNVQTADSQMIDTYRGGEQDERPVDRVTKEPLGDGRFKIVIAISCTNFFGCVPNKWNEMLAFNQSIGAIRP